MSKSNKPARIPLKKKRRIFSMRMRGDDTLTAPMDGPTFGEYVSFIRSPWKAFFYSFLRGTGFGLGTLIGAAVVIALLSFLIKELGWIPVIGEWLIKFGKIVRLP